MQDASGLLNRCHVGCALDVLPRLAAQGLQAQCVVTSPPYWGLRDYFRIRHDGRGAQGLGRRWVGVELNPGYGALQAERTAQTGLPL